MDKEVPDVCRWVKNSLPLTSWLLSVNFRVVVRPQIYRGESRVLYELIFVAFIV